MRYVGHFQTRNRGTIGGSLCQLDPSAELPAVAMAYDATVIATSPRGQRSLSFCEFPVTYMTSVLAPDEILTSVRFAPWQGKVGTGFSEFSRRHGDFAVAGAIAMLESDERGAIRRASLTLFGISEAPKRARDAEEALIGRQPTRKLIDETAKLCIAHATLEDTFGSAEYRGHVAASMAEAALSEAAAELHRQ